jgi:hypothetical protein
LKWLRRGRKHGSFWGVDDWRAKRLTDAELKEFFERLFPHGFAGTDVLSEIAPEGWETSPLLACFHPSVEKVFQERVQLHRNIEELIGDRREREPDNSKLAPKPEPTLEEVRADWQDKAVNVCEEVTDLVALCLWDVFSNSHDVLAADGRLADIGSFRGAAGFLVEYLTGPNDDLWSMDYCRFYMGTIWISDRADLTPVYAMIFHRLKTLGADWEFHFRNWASWICRRCGRNWSSQSRRTIRRRKPLAKSRRNANGRRSWSVSARNWPRAVLKPVVMRWIIRRQRPFALIKRFMAATQKAGRRRSGGHRLFFLRLDRPDARGLPESFIGGRLAS